jgi:DNA replication and repair protein RecF
MLIQARITAIQEIDALARQIHGTLTHGSETLRINYLPAFDPIPRPDGQIALRMDTVLDRSGLGEEDIRNGFLDRLQKVRNEEIARGVTTIGPHRDELRFLANTHDLGDYGSRGQVRTALLALKLAEVEWMKKKTGQWPVILLDEVMAELDVQRRSDLLAYMGNMEQALLTTTDLHLFAPDFVKKTETWEVNAGAVKVIHPGEK